MEDCLESFCCCEVASLRQCTRPVARRPTQPGGLAPAPTGSSRFGSEIDVQLDSGCALLVPASPPHSVSQCPTWGGLGEGRSIRLPTHRPFALGPSTVWLG